LAAASDKDREHLQVLNELGLRSYICVPLLSHGAVLGVLTFATAESGWHYRQEDLQAAEDLARRVVIAIENANLYRALQEADRRKDEFLATLAHELRNPLAPVRHWLEILKRGGDNSSELAHLARETMDRQVSHMERLIDDLMDISRITRNRLELRCHRVELATIIGNAVEVSRPLTESFGHTLAVNLPEEPIYLHADPVRLSQVLGNLLSNACKYTPAGGRICLTVERRGQDARIAVSDNGMGISADMLPRIFEMFTQANRASDRAPAGLGIGLTLVKQLVEMHGGSVEAQSAGEGQGSTFVVTLPLLAGHLEVEPPREPAPAAGMDGAATRRVLVVDDNQDGANSLAVLLRLSGHEVQVAHDGLQAVETAGDYRPEIIFLDIGLPKLNGYDVCRQIRGKPWGKEIVIVALTGWGQDGDRRKSQEAGFDQHLIKPVHPDALMRVLDDLPTAVGG
ncbi:MAG TPA: ATP-binding protein, partial [Pirellulaceae bacterium]|nr:ATP-binding protein [Pirellulaceae bacterium]